MKDLLLKKGQLIKSELAEISDYIYANPELGNEEHKAVDVLTQLLSKHGFTVEKSYLEIETAFRCVYDSGKPGLTVGYICEYDALPQIGHGCGHNMIGPMSAGAAIVLTEVMDQVGGKIIVYGTPAEETDGGKVYLAEKGAFDELDAAMMAHPARETVCSGTSMAIHPLEFTYTGKTSHAASAPHEGINALNAVIQLFNGIDALRQHVTDDVRMHGVITEGGVAANIVPDRAVAQFYFRANTKEALEELVPKVQRIAEGAALMTGATLSTRMYEIGYDNLMTNETLSEAFNENLRELGITEIKKQAKFGSSDIGNVSHKTPTIHPNIGIGLTDIIPHSIEFAKATTTEFAHERLLTGALALAYTGLDVLSGKVKL